ncbi:hypothetical protein Trichorick_00273 [Candidatus Trichorickettsia mobilis]|uniref:Uncharacterized protein n=1 Tax=Candidatus Trichorickettsia mobilis TaxID=1346319 RepID=A0ABZ0UU42_9RICK|nr:hypothetical protein [Candidatus Trichorickettsia mobilis]WPY00399.1 hypothetical protein Trichorick_00273 [Candidatus Trichorickettsia mobilis]
MTTLLDTTEPILYQIENLSSAKEYITNTQNPLIITNSPNSIKYYGILVLDYIFKTLQKEFPKTITDIIVDVGDDHAALFTAKKLGYKNIKYTGNSNAAKIMNTEY